LDKSDLQLEAYGVVRHSEEGSAGVEFSQLVWRGLPLRRSRTPLVANVASPLLILSAIVMLAILFPNLRPHWTLFWPTSTSQPTQFAAPPFTVGSTEADVRAAQGPPATMTDTVWQYGASRVYTERHK